MDNIKSQALARIKASPDLPSPNESARLIIQLTQSDDVSIAQIEHAVRTDPAFVARLIKLANSAGVSAGGRPIVAIKDALLVLGLPAVRGLALGFSLLEGYRQGRCAHFDFRLFWSRSLAMASAFQAIVQATKAAPADEAFSIGLLANIGQLALAAVFPEDYGEILAGAESDPETPVPGRERTRFGFNRWELSAELMSDWGLPKVYVEPVRLQQDSSGQPTIGTRAYLLTHSLALAAAIAEIILFPSHRTPEKVTELYRQGARVSLESADVIDIGKRVAKDWVQWADLFKLPKDDAIDFSWVEQAAADSRLLVQASGNEGVALRVLLVDDERTSRLLLGKILKDAGFAVLEAENGEQALAMVMQSPPDIVVTDWSMPVMDGIEMIRRLRQTTAGNSLYILMVTAQTEEDYLVQAFGAGTDDFIAKPVKPRVLRARLKAAERIVRLQREAERHHEELRNIAAELSASNRRLQELSITDVLTGCPNRRYALERLQQEWSAASRRATPLSCLIVDIDWFKQINDQYGHDRGDEVLKAIATALRAGVRAQDVVCRVGGDEFWIICPDADKEAVMACAKRLCQAVDDLEIHGGDIKCSISIGAAERLPGMLGLQALIEAADRNLYRAKRDGRGRVIGADAASPLGPQPA